MSKKNLMIVFLIFTIMFGLNSLTPMMYGDDYVYAFKWSGRSMYIPLSENVERISSFIDIIESQRSHYLTGNGRLLSHIFVQFFVWQSKILFNIINSAMFVLLILEIYWVSDQGRVSFNNIQTGSVLVIFFSLWAFTVNFSGVFLWISGACNYLWMTTFLLSFIILYVRKYFQMGTKIIKSGFAQYLIFVWGIIAGWTNENTICWLVLFLGLWLLKCRKEPGLEPWMWYGLAGLCVGYMFLVFAPGNAVRASSYTNATLQIWSWRFMRLKLITFGLVEFFEIFLWFFIITSWRKIKNIITNDSVSRQLNLVKLFCSLNLLSNGIMLLTPEFPARSGFASLVFLLVATITLIRIQSTPKIKLIDTFSQSFIAVISSFYFLISLCATFAGMLSTYQYDKNVLELVKQNKAIQSQAVLEIPPPPVHSEVLLNVSGRHLVRPCLKGNENEWENVAFARYYDIKGIRVK